jgi:WD40 repeat protein/serine/threonine protein kinase
MNRMNEPTRPTSTENVVPTDSAGRWGTRLVSVLIRQARDWRHGQLHPAESYLKQVPALGEDPEAVLDLIYHERVLRAERGEVPRLDEYVQRFPHLAGQLEVQFELDRALQEERTWDLGVQQKPAPGAAPAAGTPGLVASSPPGYEILEELGRGGMGIVYRAWQIGLKRLVTLKVIQSGDLSDSGQRSRFRTEAEAIGRLQHPNIVQVFEVGDHAGRPYLALEYVDGGSLAEQLDGTPRPAREAAGLVETLARAIDYAHRRSVIHRDLKPSNVLLATQKDGREPGAARRREHSASGAARSVADWTPKITDFGLAKILSEGLAGQTRTGDLMGTPSYMAPEQAGSAGGPRRADRASALGPAADIYSLGATLYELLTGRPPFKAETPLATLHQVVSQEPVAPSRLQGGLARDLETICLKCLNKEPRRRYAAAAELADDLHRYLEGMPIHARRASAVERAWRWCRRNPPLAVASALAAAAILATIALAIGFGVAERRHALRLEDALAETQAERRRATKLAAGATFERGIALCEQGQRDRGLLMLCESLRLIVEPNADLPPAPLARTIRVTLADWMGRSFSLAGFLNHDAAPGAMALAPDGRLAATGGPDGTARLWSTADGRLIAMFPHSAAVRGVAFVPGGDALLSYAGDAAVLWDLRSKTSRRSFSHSSEVLAAEFDSHGRRLVLAGADGRAQIVDVASGSRIGVVLRHEGQIGQVRFLPPDGRTVLTAADDRTSRLWRSDTGQPQGAPIPLTERPVCVAASPGGRSVLIGCRDGAARLWDSVTGSALGAVLRHDAEVSAGLFRSDGRMLVTGSRDGSVRVWEVGEKGIAGAPRVLRHAAPITSLALADDGRTLVAGCRSSQAFVWDVARLPHSPVHTLPHLGEVYRVAISGDGRTVVTSGQETSARLWKLPQAVSPGVPVSEKDIVYSMAISPDRTVLATGGDEGIARLWDAASGRKLGEMPHGDAIRGVAFLPGGDSLVTAGEDRSAVLWDTSARTPRRRFPGTSKLHSLAVSPDGRLLLTGARDGRVTLWEIETASKRIESVLHSGPILALAFSPDGRSFASASADQTALLSHIDDLVPIAPPMRHEGQVWVTAFRPDGRVLLTGGDAKTVHLWDTATGRPFGPSLDHDSPFRLAAFTPDGRDVLIGSDAGKSRFWDLDSEKPLGAPLDAAAWILAARFDPVTGEVITASEGVTLDRRRMPRPLAGDPETVAFRIQAMTGLRLQSGGSVQVLDRTAWQDAVNKSQTVDSARQGPNRLERWMGADKRGLNAVGGDGCPPGKAEADNRRSGS